MGFYVTEVVSVIRPFNIRFLRKCSNPMQNLIMYLLQETPFENPEKIKLLDCVCFPSVQLDFDITPPLS